VIVKKAQKTPKQDLDLAKKRRDMFLSGGGMQDEK
jgi:phage-related protein